MIYLALIPFALALVAAVLIPRPPHTPAQLNGTLRALAAYRLGAAVIVNEGGPVTWGGTYMGVQNGMCVIRDNEAPYATAHVYKENVFPEGFQF